MTRPAIRTVLVIVVLAAFCAAFVAIDQVYYAAASSRFPFVGTSTWLATLWGVVSRAHVVLIALPVVLWRPRFFGFQLGSTRKHVPLLLAMLVVNCGVIAAYLWATKSTTPYSGDQWLLTESVIVPIVEETVWRGIVFSVLLLVFEKLYSRRASTHLTVWLSGLAFGTLHAANALAGVPVAFVAVQTLSAMVWGVMYGYARARTDSVYPPMLLHAAMNLVVALF